VRGSARVEPLVIDLLSFPFSPFPSSSPKSSPSPSTRTISLELKAREYPQKRLLSIGETRYYQNHQLGFVRLMSATLRWLWIASAGALVLVLVLPLQSSAPHAQDRPAGIQSDLDKLRVEANRLFEARQFDRAFSLYEQGLRRSEAQKDHRARAKFLIGIANVEAKRSRASAAIANYVKARSLANAVRDRELAATISFNLSQLYLHLGNFEAARVTLQPLTESGTLKSPAVASAKVTLSILEASDARSRRLFLDSLRILEDQGRIGPLCAHWSEFGRHLERYDRQAAFHAYIEALRLSYLGQPQCRVFALFGLAEHFLQKGDLKSSALYNDAVLESLPRSPSVSLWRAQFQRARILAERSPEQAFKALEDAIETSNAWRRKANTSHGDFQASAGYLRSLYDFYVRLSVGHPRSIRASESALQLAELAKMDALEEQMRGSYQNHPDYLSTQAKLRSAEAAALRADSRAFQAIDRLTVELSELESVLSSHQSYQNKFEKGEKFAEPSSLSDWRERLGSDETLISFHLSEEGSAAWAVTKSKLEFVQIGAAKELGEKIAQIRQQITTGTADGVREGGRGLYRALFGKFSPGILENRQWILSVDKQLFELPFSALTLPDGRYLAEKHSVRFVLSAMSLQRPTAGIGPSRLVAYGDPIYNRADPRWKSGAADPQIEGEEFDLARLPGTSRELKTVVNEFPVDRAISLTGTHSSRTKFFQFLEPGAQIVHYAGHVLQSPKRPELVTMMMGLNPSGQQDFLSPAEISSKRLSLGLVTLSGCGSGLGKPLAGAGLLGLSRAWLLAGAQAVTASLWPLTDDSGELFRYFYRDLAQRKKKRSGLILARDIANSLQDAQKLMLQSGGWRAEPQYWATYFVLGKD
jgi:CHAT domain-containing protein